MSIPTGVIANLRDQWADRFVDTVTIRRVSAVGSVDPTTFVISGASNPIVYTGAALIRPVAAAGGLINEVGLAETRLDQYMVLLPFTGVGLKADDRVTVDQSVTGGPDLVGSVLTVLSVEIESYKTRVALRCLLADRGSE